MQRRSVVISVLRWSVILLAYGYVAYSLVQFPYYSDLARAWGQASAWRYVALLGCVCLMPLNLYLESWRWRRVMRPVLPLSRREAIEQVLSGLRGGFITPYQVGDGPARVLAMRDTSLWLSAIGMMVVTSVAMNLIILTAGLMGLGGWRFITSDSVWSLMLAGIGACVCMACFVPVVRMLSRRKGWSEKVGAALTSMAALSARAWGSLLTITALRYITFSVQMYLALVFVGVDMPVCQALIVLPVYYLVLLLAPTMPALDAGIKGAVAIWLWGQVSPGCGVSAALAAVVIWLVNTLLPVLVSPLICIKNSSPLAYSKKKH